MRVLIVLAFLLPAGAQALRQTSGRYQLTLRLPDAGLSAREEMQIEFRIEDTSRPDPLTGFAPVIRARPEATIDMPSMPGMPKFDEIAHPEGVPGDYGIHPTFAHGGEFRLKILVHPPNAEAFEIVFPLQVMDASERKRLPPRYTLEIGAQPKKPKAGVPVTVRFVILDHMAENKAVSSFDITHEALMHLVIVRRDLSHFAHEHPQFEPDGFRLQYTFRAGGEYRLFADIAPKGAGSQILMAKLNVSGADVKEPRFQTGPTRIELPRESWPVHKSTTVAFTLRDAADGRPVTDLEPYLGAPGHLMLVHEDAETFVHSHPNEDASSGTLLFLARFPKVGVYRGWMQFRRNGQVWTASVTLRAGEAK